MSRAKRTYPPTDREVELANALDEAMLALMDIDAVVDLLKQEGTLGEAEFPERIAGAIRMIGYRASTVTNQLAEVP